MIKQDWKETDILKVEDFNNIVKQIQQIALVLMKAEKSISQKEQGDFFFTEELKEIENILVKYDTDFQKKEWHNMTTISYEDVNRWSKAINKIQEALKKTGRLITEDRQFILTEEGSYILTEKGELL